MCPLLWHLHRHVIFSRLIFLLTGMQHLLCDGVASVIIYGLRLISLKYFPFTMPRSKAIISLVNSSYTPQCRWQKSKYTKEMFLYMCVEGKNVVGMSLFCDSKRIIFQIPLKMHEASIQLVLKKFEWIHFSKTVKRNLSYSGLNPIMVVDALSGLFCKCVSGWWHQQCFFLQMVLSATTVSTE